MSQLDILSRDEGVVKIPCICVDQPIGSFYIGAIKSTDLIEITFSDVRRMEGERGFESYLGIQRPLSPKRAVEIASYTNTVDACFPTAVILSVPARCAEYDADSRTLVLSAYDTEEGLQEQVRFKEIAKVIDGQHRIAGLEGYRGEKEFWVNVSIFVDIEVSAEANIFSTVNLAQTKVNKSLTYDLYDLAKKRSPQKLCHDIAVTLDSDDESPFASRIKRLGAAERHNLPGSITQAAFVQALMKYLSVEPIKDRDMYMRGLPLPVYPQRTEARLIFRHFLIAERDMELTAIMWNYFSAVRERWPEAWNSTDKGIMLSKTNGFMALMRFLKDCYLYLEIDVPSQKSFYNIFEQIEIDGDYFTTGNYPPGTSGESALYKDLKEGLARF